MRNEDVQGTAQERVSLQHNEPQHREHLTAMVAPWPCGVRICYRYLPRYMPGRRSCQWLVLTLYRLTFRYGNKPQQPACLGVIKHIADMVCTKHNVMFSSRSTQDSEFTPYSIPTEETMSQLVSCSRSEFPPTRCCCASSDSRVLCKCQSFRQRQQSIYCIQILWRYGTRSYLVLLFSLEIQSAPGTYIPPFFRLVLLTGKKLLLIGLRQRIYG